MFPLTAFPRLLLGVGGFTDFKDFTLADGVLGPVGVFEGFGGDDAVDFWGGWGLAGSAQWGRGRGCIGRGQPRDGMLSSPKAPESLGHTCQDVLECELYAASFKGRGFHEHELILGWVDSTLENQLCSRSGKGVLTGELLSIGRRHSPQMSQINLVPDQHDDDIRISMIS